MTDNLPPQPPLHNRESMMQPQPEQQPVPSRSVQRTKTVRNNLGNAGNKVRGLFKKQSNKEVENTRSVPREDTPSYSSGTRNWERPSIPRSFSGQDVFREIPERPSSQATDSNTPTEEQPNESRASSAYIPNDHSSVMSVSAAPPINSSDGNGSESTKLVESDDIDDVSTEELLKELEKVNADIARVKKEVATEAEKKQALQSMLEDARRMVQAQEQEYTQIEHKYFEDTRPIRATDDDLSTIRETFKLLKYSIARIIMTLNRKADKAQATEKFEKLWPGLKLTENGELESSHINLLAEKIVHQHLVKHIFRCPIYPGLEVNDAYSSVSKWLTKHGSQFPVRLRQQLASIVAKSAKDSPLHKAAQSEKQKIIDIIYNDLADIYHPFLRENDANVDEEKRYYAKITDIVEKAMKLSVAIRGQEVDIKILDIKEGHDEFDEETMVDVKGKTSGIVRFCICPPFVGGDGEHGFVEKGKVVLA